MVSFFFVYFFGDRLLLQWLRTETSKIDLLFCFVRDVVRQAGTGLMIPNCTKIEIL